METPFGIKFYNGFAAIKINLKLTDEWLDKVKAHDGSEHLEIRRIEMPPCPRTGKTRDDGLWVRIEGIVAPDKYFKWHGMVEMGKVWTKSFMATKRAEELQCWIEGPVVMQEDDFVNDLPF